jgi:divalent metal cation (Fe/Co/Zn/Cd) transporter
MQTKDITLNIPVEFLWFVLALALIFFIIMSFIFRYHWKEYGVYDNPKVFAKTLYWIVCFMLIVLMAVALIVFET